MEDHHKIVKQNIERISDGQRTVSEDLVTIEEPLEMQLVYGPENKREKTTLAITMRTPGDDPELMRGFLFTEGIISRADDIIDVQQIEQPESLYKNICRVDLSPELNFNPLSLSRHFYTTSSCGVCGKTSIEMVHLQTAFRITRQQMNVSQEVIYQAFQNLNEKQEVFGSTGGIHAAALFDASGKIHYLKEDIGRHNAVDKVFGASMKQLEFPLDKFGMIVSGRAGFELVQKSVIAGVPLFLSVGATSSLSIELAEQNGMTLIGFLKSDRFNIYTHPERVIDK